MFFFRGFFFSAYFYILCMQNIRRFRRVLYAYYVYYIRRSSVVACQRYDDGGDDRERNGSRVHAINQMENYNNIYEQPIPHSAILYLSLLYIGRSGIAAMEMSKQPTVGPRFGPVVSITFLGPHKNRINILLLFFLSNIFRPAVVWTDPYTLCCSTNNLQPLQKP